MRTYKVTVCQKGKPNASLDVIAKHVVDAVIIARGLFPASCSVVARAA